MGSDIADSERENEKRRRRHNWRRFGDHRESRTDRIGKYPLLRAPCCFQLRYDNILTLLGLEFTNGWK